MAYDANGEWQDDPVNENVPGPNATPLPNGWSVTGNNGQTPFADNYGPGSNANSTPPPSGGGGYTPKVNDGGDRSAALQRIQQQYQSSLGRAATSQEIASEQENLNKYDTSYVLGQIDKRKSNAPNNGMAQGPQGYTSGQGGYGSNGQNGQNGSNGASNMDAFLAYLKSKDSAAQGNQDALRKILMEQLGAASSPVSADAPGIRDVLAGRRIASQRNAERLRAQAAESMGAQGLGQSGALNAKLEGINQQQGEADTQGTGQLLFQELGAKRQQLTNLLSLAVQSGDAESARNIAAQLEAIRAQMQQGQFTDSLNQRGQQFNDQLGFNYNSLNANQNSGGLEDILRMAMS